MCQREWQIQVLAELERLCLLYTTLLQTIGQLPPNVAQQQLRVASYLVSNVHALHGDHVAGLQHNLHLHVYMVSE